MTPGHRLAPLLFIGMLPSLFLPPTLLCSLHAKTFETKRTRCLVSKIKRNLGKSVRGSEGVKSKRDVRTLSFVKVDERRKYLQREGAYYPIMLGNSIHTRKSV